MPEKRTASHICTSTIKDEYDRQTDSPLSKNNVKSDDCVVGTGRDEVADGVEVFRLWCV